tara:strand:+ start:10758 stop:11018 length:261 start_codon:yes stop_codon:yes gene_type:complete
MNAETQIKKKLSENLGLKNVDVINNSYLHKNHSSSPKSGNSHFKIVIYDEYFFKLSRIKSHQKIYNCLSEEMNSFIHALEIEIKGS